jgi:hypothetical protein
MNRFLILILYLFLARSEAGSQNTLNGIPKVVIGMVVENMRPDYIDRFWNDFGNDGFKKLYTQGICYSDFRMDAYFQNNASGTATLFTGVTPSVHGIVGKNWYDRTKGIEKNCVSDDKFISIGNNTGAGGVSPLQLRSYTIAEQLKLFTNGKSKVFSVAMNEAPAIFSSGFSGDGAFWFDNITGNMITSSFYLQKLPGWAEKFNLQNLAKTYSEKNWALLKPIPDYSESLPDNDSLEAGYGPGLNVFPHNLNELVKKAGNYAPLKTTPFANSIITSFVIDLLEHEQIGTDEFPDLITLFFSSMDEKLEMFGPASVEMEDLYLRIDQEIAGIIQYCENRYGKGNVLVFLTSNSSASYPVNYLKEKFRIPTGSFSCESAYALLNSYLNVTFGDLRWIEYFDGQQVYLNHKLIELNKVDMKEIREKTADFLTQFEGIQMAVTADQLEQGNTIPGLPDGIPETYVPYRSGDVFFVLREGWQPVSKFREDNNSGQPFLPLVFYRAGTSHRIITTPYDATDFAPSISKLLHILKPPGSRGKELEGF